MIDAKICLYLGADQSTAEVIHCVGDCVTIGSNESLPSLVPAADLESGP